MSICITKFKYVLCCIDVMLWCVSSEITASKNRNKLILPPKNHCFKIMQTNLMNMLKIIASKKRVLAKLAKQDMTS